MVGLRLALDLNKHASHPQTNLPIFWQFQAFPLRRQHHTHSIHTYSTVTDPPTTYLTSTPDTFTMVNVINVALRGLEVLHALSPRSPSCEILTTFPNQQIFFAIVILGLSANLVKTQAYGGAPSITNYEVFLGIWLFVISFLGIAGDFIGALGGVVMVALDALTVLFTFAGGVVSSPFSSLTALSAQSRTRRFYSLRNLSANEMTGTGRQTRRALLLLQRRQLQLRVPGQQRRHQRRQEQQGPGRPAHEPRVQVPRGAGGHRLHLVRVRGFRGDVRAQLLELEEGRDKVREGRVLGEECLGD